MALHQVDVVDPKSFQAILYFDFDGVGTQADGNCFAIFHAIRRATFVFPPDSAFCGDNSLVAPALDCFADYLFRVTPAVRGCGIDEVDPCI